MSAPTKPILAIDPGREKCGVAVVDAGGKILAHCIVVPEKMREAVSEQIEVHRAETIVLGDATASRAMWEVLENAFPQMQIVSIAEKNSTLEAREIYWRENPPSGWRKIVPLSLQVPPVPIDDYAAVVLALRYWNGRTDTNPAN